MERTLIANSLVPDDEVWVSLKTWDSPFTQSKVAQNSTSTNTTKAKISSNIIESVSVCDYCDNRNGCTDGGFCDGTPYNFVGRKLSAIC